MSASLIIKLDLDNPSDLFVRDGLGSSGVGGGLPAPTASSRPAGLFDGRRRIASLTRLSLGIVTVQFEEFPTCAVVECSRGSELVAPFVGKLHKVDLYRVYVSQRPSECVLEVKCLLTLPSVEKTMPSSRMRISDAERPRSKNADLEDLEEEDEEGAMLSSWAIENLKKPRMKKALK